MIVVTALIIEVVNVNLVGFQINKMSRLAFKLACEYFAQETYKREDSTLGNMPDILNENNLPIISGTFYSGSTEKEVYDKLYKDNDNFRTWAEKHSGKWSAFDLLLLGMGIPSKAAQTEENYYLGKFYSDSLVTPINIGITYLDKDTVERIAKWNLAEIFSVGNPNVIVDKAGSEPYIRYKGFRIYPQSARLREIEYTIINAVSEADKFREITGIDPTRLGFDGPTDERANICIANIKYSVPIAYEGVSPLKKIMEFVWNKELERVPNDDDVLGYSEIVSDGPRVSPVPGDIVYFVLR